MNKEKKVTLLGCIGELEGLWLEPAGAREDVIALIAHPHPLFGGTMNNKVVTTLAKAFAELNISSLRFNSRGVGASEGKYAKGLGEADDFLKIAKQLKEQNPEAKFIFAGFSFGAFVSAKAAMTLSPTMLISVAPSVENFNFNDCLFKSNPWLVLVPLADEVVSAEAALTFFAGLDDNVKLETFENTSHFFHGQLLPLRERVVCEVQKHL